MEENKRTLDGDDLIEDVLKRHFKFLAVSENLMFNLKNAFREFGTIQTDRLAALNKQYKKQINELEAKRLDEHLKNNAMAKGLIPKEYTEKVQQLTAENERLREDKRIVDFIMELDYLTTGEFCKKYDIELPSWKGNVELAASEFIRLDAIKLKKIVDFAKQLRCEKAGINLTKED